MQALGSQGRARRRGGVARARRRRAGVLRSRQACLDLGNSGAGVALGDGSGRRLPDRGDLRRRRLAARAPDAARARSAAADGGAAAACQRRRALPLALQGARDPMPIVYRTPVPSAQIKSAVLLAGLAAPGATTVVESETSRDHTERLLTPFRRGGRGRAGGRARPQDHSHRAAGARRRRWWCPPIPHPPPSRWSRR